MILVLVGALMIAAGVHMVRGRSVPRGAVQIPGLVVAVDRRQSQLTGGARTLYGPTVEYRDPESGAIRRLQAEAYEQTRFEVGDELVVAHDPTTGQAKLAKASSPHAAAVPFVAGIAVMALGVWDLAS